MLNTESEADQDAEAERSIVRDVGGALLWESDEWASQLYYVGPSVERLLGYSAEELKTQAGVFKRLVHHEDWPRVLDAIHRAASEGGAHTREHRMVRRDGAVVWMQTTVSRSGRSNGTVLLSGLTVDVTGVKSTELEVRNAEADARLLIDNLRDFGVFALTVDGKVATWNSSARRLKGYTEEEALGSPIERFFPLEAVERDIPRRIMERAQADGRAEYEGWLVRKGGNRFWGNLIITSIIDSHGRLRGFSNIARDLTDRKNAEEALRLSEEQFRLLIESQEYAVFLTSSDGAIENWNRAAQRLEGYRPHEIIGTSFSLLFPEEELASRIPEDLMHEAARMGTTNYEGWLLRKGGTKFWGLLTVSAVEDESGHLRGFSMLARDVSERKRTEQALRESEEYFRLLVGSIQDYGMFMVSPEGIVQSWNHGAQRLKRYRSHEVVGGPIHRFFPPEAQDSAARLIEDAIVKGTATYEGWLVRKGGERFWALCTLSAVEDESGHLRGLSNVARDLTERKRTEDALRDSEERLRLLVNSVQDYAVFMVSASGEVISWNAGAERLHGFSAQEAVGAVVARLLGASEADAGMAERLLRRAREVGRAEFEGWLMRKGGATFWASVIFNAVRDSAGNLHGYSVVARDLTERMRADRAQAFLSEVGSLLAGSLDYQTTLDRVTRLATQSMAQWCAVEILDGNTLRPVALAHVNSDEESVLQHAMHDIPSTPRTTRGVAHVVLSGLPELEPDIVGVYSVEEALGMDARDGFRALVTGSYICVPLAARGRTFGAMVLMAAPGRRYSQDDLLLAQELSRRASLAIESARLYEQAQRAIRMREDVLAVVSHDLRSPLGAIRTSADQLKLHAGRMDGHPEQVSRIAERIQRASQRMMHMIRDLLDLSNIEAGRLSIEPADHDASELAEAAADMLKEVAAEKGLRLEVLPANSRTHVRCDRERILQVFSNLIGNAIKFSNEGSSINVGVRDEPGRVVFCVEDRGSGIPEDQLAHVFERYVHRERRAGGGLGLGLAISKAIIEAHGGAIWARSTLGEGSTFCFSLPRTT
ncbi:PAS domain S-box protein [Pyxidicoccus sp. 3LFB2]